MGYGRLEFPHELLSGCAASGRAAALRAKASEEGQNKEILPLPGCLRVTSFERQQPAADKQSTHAQSE
jgi:hypothetical protein